MKSIFLISSLLLTLNVTAMFTPNVDIYSHSECDSLAIEQCLLQNVFDYSKNPEIEVSDIEVYEVEEDVVINFDTKQYLPNNFNPLKGKHNIDWQKVELVEIEEDVHICFDTTKYLPGNFNAIKGKHDLDWTKIELLELEEETVLDFNTKDYLPEDFNPNKGMCKSKLIL